MAFTPSNIVGKKKYTLEPGENSSDTNQFCSDQDNYYILDAVIQHRESRNVEFKAAQGNYVMNTLPESLDKYGVAFVNGDGGTLYLGITDGGQIKGIPWRPGSDRQVHKVVRATFERFLPSTPSYSVRIVPIYTKTYDRWFAPVMRAVNNKRVVRIEVHPGRLPNIWENGTHKVWVKRDGSVEELNPLQIKDLAITKYKESLKLRKTTSR